MSMTKKDFVALAGAINEVMWTKNADPATVVLCMGRIAEVCAQANPSFDRGRFVAAALKDQP